MPVRSPLQALQRLMGGNQGFELPEVAPAPPLPIKTPSLDQDIPDPRMLKITDPSGVKTGKYPQFVAEKISDAASLRGIDPIRALAMALQESSIGRDHSENPLQFVPMSSDEQDESNYIETFPPAAQMELNLDRALGRYDTHYGRQAKKTPDDEALNIQSYNGMGRIQGGDNFSHRPPMYGGQTDLIGRRDKPYGKRILELEGLLKSQPEIQKIIK